MDKTLLARKNYFAELLLVHWAWSRTGFPPLTSNFQRNRLHTGFKQYCLDPDQKLPFNCIKDVLVRCVDHTVVRCANELQGFNPSIVLLSSQLSF